MKNTNGKTMHTLIYLNLSGIIFKKKKIQIILLLFLMAISSIAELLLGITTFFSDSF